jgi:hypothetical protein
VQPIVDHRTVVRPASPDLWGRLLLLVRHCTSPVMEAYSFRACYFTTAKAIQDDLS